MHTHIFNIHGSVSSVEIQGDPDDAPKAFFSLTKNMEKQDSYQDPDADSEQPKQALFGNLPVSGLTVDQAVDHTISKTLNRDFVISEFGDTPVQIVMNGVSFYGDCEGAADGWGNTNEQIMDFYEKNKLSKDPSARFTLSITPGQTECGTFTCVLIKMKAIGPAMERQGTVPVYSYNITLIGVRAS